MRKPNLLYLSVLQSDSRCGGCMIVTQIGTREHSGPLPDFSQGGFDSFPGLLCGPPLIQLAHLGSAVISPIGVWGKAWWSHFGLFLCNFFSLRPMACSVKPIDSHCPLCYAPEIDTFLEGMGKGQVTVMKSKIVLTARWQYCSWWRFEISDRR